MPVEQMNITLSPQMVRFIRSKVEKGEYTNISEVVRDAVRRMQEVEASRKDREWLAGFEESLPKTERAVIGRKVHQGIKDMEAGNYQSPLPRRERLAAQRPDDVPL